MKKILILLILFFSLSVHAQTDTSGLQVDTAAIKFIEPPDSTAIGTPDGKLVSKEIGITGGTIISEDGRVELIFPAGALTANTNISIQPTNNLAPNGAGKAYAFEPSGIQFKKPVQIIFRYTDEEAETCPADLMGFALQDHTGRWSFIDYTSWDSIGKKLIGILNHFSQASNVYMLEIHAQHSSLRVGERTSISILELIPKFKNKRGKTQYTYGLGRLTIDKRLEWTVNEDPNGNEFVGEIFGAKIHIMKGDPPTYYSSWEYDAPKNGMPDENPVTIKAWLGTYDADNYFRPKAPLSCKIEIYDEYKVLIKDTIEARLGMGTFVADSGSFLVRITQNGVILKEINNYPPYSYKLFNPPRPFKIEVYTGNPCLGTINIGPIYSAQMLKNKPHTPSDVLITFPTPEILAFRFEIRARGIKTKVESAMLESEPDLVDFIENGKVQTLRVRGKREAPYDIYIIPIRDVWAVDQ